MAQLVFTVIGAPFCQLLVFVTLGMSQDTYLEGLILLQGNAYSPVS